MALDETVLRTTPQYWTAAVYRRTSRGLIFQGWMPTVKISWSRFLDRVMGLGFDVQTKPYYWDGTRWVNDSSGNSPAFRVSGDVTIGKLERKSPLPVARYWQDIFAKQADDWNAWLSNALKTESVKIVKAEHFNADPLRDGSWLPTALQPDNAGTIGDRTWVLFDVVKPIDWPAVKLGFPTIADATVQTSADTAQNPPGKSPTDEIKDAVLDVVKPIAYLGAGYLALKILLSLRK